MSPRFPVPFPVALFSAATAPAAWSERWLPKALALALGLLALLLAFGAQAWTLDDATSLAKSRAQQAWQAPSLVIPAELTKLDYDAYRDIRFNTDKSLWRSARLPRDGTMRP